MAHELVQKFQLFRGVGCAVLISPAELGFLLQIRRQPDLPGPRLVYADWLFEQGQCDKAEFVRLGCWKSGLKVRVPGHELSERAVQLLDAHLGDWHLPLTDPVRSEAVEVNHNSRGRVYVRVRRGGRRLWAVLDYDRGMVARARSYSLAAYRKLAPEVIQFAPCADFGLMDRGDAERLPPDGDTDRSAGFTPDGPHDPVFDLIRGADREESRHKFFDPPDAGPRARKALGWAMTLAAWKVLTGELEAL
jgi:uncharacterized protein (TIGR02996 family)